MTTEEEQTAQEQDDGFSSAFRERAAEIAGEEKAADDTEEAADEAPAVSEQSTDQQEQADDGRETQAEGRQTEEPPIEESSTTEGSEDYKALYEKEQQRARSLEGRMRKLSEQYQAAKRRGEALDGEPGDRMPDDDQPPERGHGPELSEEQRRELDEFRRAHPEVAAKSIDLPGRSGDLAREYLLEWGPQHLLMADIMSKGSASEVKRDLVAEKHYAQIAAAHPDWQEIAKGQALDEWIGNLPHRRAVECQDIINHGSADKVIALLAEFKQTRGGAPSRAPDPKKVQAATAVRPRPAGPPAGQPETFSEAFRARAEEIRRRRNAR